MISKPENCWHFVRNSSSDRLYILSEARLVSVISKARTAFLQSEFSTQAAPAKGSCKCSAAVDVAQHSSPEHSRVQVAKHTCHSSLRPNSCYSKHGAFPPPRNRSKLLETPSQKCQLTLPAKPTLRHVNRDFTLMCNSSVRMKPHPRAHDTFLSAC